jgi:hypothetical protein
MAHPLQIEEIGNLFWGPLSVSRQNRSQAPTAFLDIATRIAGISEIGE